MCNYHHQEVKSEYSSCRKYYKYGNGVNLCCVWHKVLEANLVREWVNREKCMCSSMDSYLEVTTNF
jgi:hypothetical protein